VDVVPAPDGGRARPRWIRRAAWAGAVIVVIGGSAAFLGVRAACCAAGPAGATAAGTAPAGTAPGPGGAFTLLDHEQASLAGLRGRPVLVWFVAAGCASCAVSIPAVAGHLDAFRRAGTRILVLGLYGAFGQGSTGTAALAGFGKAAAGKAFASPAWTWGLASEQLTAAFDPSGTPDAYDLLDGAGHVIYQNSVPVSTMSALLAHLPGRAAAGSRA
jgi:hypothetical protein